MHEPKHQLLLFFIVGNTHLCDLLQVQSTNWPSEPKRKNLVEICTSQPRPLMRWLLKLPQFEANWFISILMRQFLIAYRLRLNPTTKRHGFLTCYVLVKVREVDGSQLNPMYRLLHREPRFLLFGGGSEKMGGLDGVQSSCLLFVRKNAILLMCLFLA